MELKRGTCGKGREASFICFRSRGKCVTDRPVFQSLLRDAERGRFETILLHEQSRLSREVIGTSDAAHAAYHMRTAVRAGLIKKIGHQGWLGVNQLEVVETKSRS